MMKHNSLDEDLNDILSLPMFQISIHGILAMYVADIKSNSLCSSILLFIAKLNHTHRKLFKQQFNYLVIEGGGGFVNMVVCINIHILEVEQHTFSAITDGR